MTRFSRFLILGATELLLTAATAQSVSPTTETPVSFQARRLKTGQFEYQDLKDNKEVGRGRITIHPVAGSTNYRLSAEIKFATGLAGYQSQRWESVATAALAPVSATLRFGQVSGGAPIFDLKYLAGRATGFAIEGGKSKNESRRSISDTVPSDVVDQRIDWAAVLAGPLETGKHFEFHVYDPGTGVSPVTAQVGSLEEVRVPAGSFAAYRVVYRIKKAGRVEQYQVLASQDEPRFMVREEFPNGVATVLTGMTEIADSAERR